MSAGSKSYECNTARTWRDTLGPMHSGSVRCSRYSTWAAKEMLRRLPFAGLLSCAVVMICACRESPPLPRDCLGRPIDPAHPANGSVTLSWQPPADGSRLSLSRKLVGYRIYYGVDPTHLGCQVELPDISITRQSVTGLTPGLWYFAIVTFDDRFVESEASNVVTAQVD